MVGSVQSTQHKAWIYFQHGRPLKTQTKQKIYTFETVFSIFILHGLQNVHLLWNPSKVVTWTGWTHNLKQLIIIPIASSTTDLFKRFIIAACCHMKHVF